MRERETASFARRWTLRLEQPLHAGQTLSLSLLSSHVWQRRQAQDGWEEEEEEEEGGGRLPPIPQSPLVTSPRLYTRLERERESTSSSTLALGCALLPHSVSSVNALSAASSPFPLSLGPFSFLPPFLSVSLLLDLSLSLSSPLSFITAGPHQGWKKEVRPPSRVLILPLSPLLL